MGSIQRNLWALPALPLALSAALIASPAAGQDVDAKGGKELTELGQRIDRAAAPANATRVTDRIVDQWSGTMFKCDAVITCTGTLTSRALTAQDVQNLRAKGLGFGEVSILLALANKSGKPVSGILTMRQSGEGWGELARDLKLGNLGSVIKSVKATEKGVDRVALERSDTREDRLEKASKPDKPERMERPEKPMRRERPGR